MTEPEELDEDLFADLYAANPISSAIKLTYHRYDADEPAAKPVSEEISDHIDGTGNEILNGTSSNVDNLSKEEEVPDIQITAENSDQNEQPGAGVVPSYNGQDAFQGHTNNFQDGDMEIEQHNIGIKEDG